MKKRLTALAWGGALSLVMVAGHAYADVVDQLDPLHGCVGSTPNCNDNGNNTPTSLNAPNPFGFTASAGPLTGDLRIEVLVPNNEVLGALQFKISGGATTPATTSPLGEWTSGDLSAFVGLTPASPSNPIGAFLGPCSAAKPCTKDLDPGATGFFVYEADLGTNTLPSPSHPNDNLTIDTQLPLGSLLDAFLSETVTTKKGKNTTTSTDWIATAPSGAILETSDCTPGTPNCNFGPPPSPRSSVPEPSALVLIGGALLLFGLAWRRQPV